MCEKAARIAELEREIAEISNPNLPTFGAGYIKRLERLPKLRAELARLRNESPALTQGEGSEPVGEAVACRYRFKQGGWSGWHVETSEDEVKLNLALRQKSGWIEEYEVEPLYASPPPLPAGNADPNARSLIKGERGGLGWGGSFYIEGNKESIDAVHDAIFAKDRCAALDKMISEGQLIRPKGNADPRVREALIAALVSETVSVWYDESVIFKQDRLRERFGKALVLASTQSQGLVEAAEWRSMENAPRKDGTRVLMNTGDYIGVYRYSSGNKTYDFKTWQPEGNERHGHIFANDYGERGCKWLPLDLPAALRSRASDRSA